jgi:hypothetical protein
MWKRNLGRPLGGLVGLGSPSCSLLIPFSSFTDSFSSGLHRSLVARNVHSYMKPWWWLVYIFTTVSNTLSIALSWRSFLVAFLIGVWELALLHSAA